MSKLTLTTTDRKLLAVKLSEQRKQWERANQRRRHEDVKHVYDAKQKEDAE